MAKPIDLELKRAFTELQEKMVETRRKIQTIDTQIMVFNRLKCHIGITLSEIGNLPSETKTFESVGRMFLLTNLNDVRRNLKKRDLQLTTYTTELENNKTYLDKSFKESEDNIREMVQQRKEQSDAKAN